MKTFINKHPAIAILRGVTPPEVVNIGQCLYQHGIRVIEVPLNSPQAFDSIEKLVKSIPQDCLIGAGTVTTIEQAKQVKKVGGKLIISPHCDVELIDFCLTQNLTTIPGIATATEAFQAYQAGAKWLKLFPAQTYGYNHIKALSSVLPCDVKIIAVGGISQNNAQQWLTSGANALGLGNSLYQSRDSVETVTSKVKALNIALKL